MYHTMWSLLRETLLVGVLFLVLWYMYKLFLAPLFSPLRKIPGCPYIPLVGNMLEARKAEPMTNTIRWMKKYKSKIIRFYYFGGQERLLVADPEICRQILVTNSRNYKRFGIQSSFQRLTGTAPLFVLSGEPHHVIRKISNPAFSPAVLFDMIHVFQEKALNLCKKWECLQNDYADVQLQSNLQTMTLDVICKCGFGYDTDFLKSPSSSEDEDGIRSVVSGVRDGFFDFLPFSDYFPTKAKMKLKKDVRFTKALTEKIIESQKNEKSTRRDILTMLTTACDTEGSHLSKKELIDQVFGFLLAGFDTTSIALTWTLLQLSERPDLQQKVRGEMSLVLGDDINRTITHEELDALKLTTAVIKETQRLFPVLPVIFRTALADDNFKGYHIPKGTIVGLHVGALHRLNWDSPEEFDPNRFMQQENVASMTFLPFSYGPYMCIGHKFSMMEMKTVLSVLLRQYYFEPVPGFKYRKLQSAVLRPNPPAVIRVKPCN
ncbi:cytochrome P450 3A9-like [Saccostrea cucullata]|uniref:cytochrome P450 3A9-like n=2 Tax=Saccostrea cuccullata TaxID=36930 RepID=UPI002ED22CFD